MYTVSLSMYTVQYCFNTVFLYIQWNPCSLKSLFWTNVFLNRFSKQFLYQFMNSVSMCEHTNTPQILSASKHTLTCSAVLWPACHEQCDYHVLTSLFSTIYSLSLISRPGVFPGVWCGVKSESPLPVLASHLSGWLKIWFERNKASSIRWQGVRCYSWQHIFCHPATLHLVSQCLDAPETTSATDTLMRHEVIKTPCITITALKQGMPGRMREASAVLSSTTIHAAQTQMLQSFLPAKACLVQGQTSFFSNHNFILFLSPKDI